MSGLTPTRFIRRQIVRVHRECHLGGNFRQGLRQEVRGAHPRLHRTEWMFNGLAPRTRGFRARVETFLSRLQVLVLPACDPPSGPGVDRRSRARPQGGSTYTETLSETSV